ncbi:CoA pyrophosphatase [bacterium]|jgi:8-oxo-dGTP pyrophosphatase MutT (NUDIX family)|nr:CoA pyrophosphatase [bacterium]
MSTLAQAEFEEQLKQAIENPLAYFDRPIPLSGTPAGVLVLFGVSPGEVPKVLLTQRTDTVEKHKGQIAFPGGMLDPEDVEHGGLVATALRETEEEVGISRELVRVHGILPDFPTTTGFVVTPVLSTLKQPPEQVLMTLNSFEIADTFWVSLEELKRPGVYSTEIYEARGKQYPIHVFNVEAGGERRIWGATGAILKNILDRLEAVVSK